MILPWFGSNIVGEYKSETGKAQRVTGQILYHSRSATAKRSATLTQNNKPSESCEQSGLLKRTWTWRPVFSRNLPNQRIFCAGCNQIYRKLALAQAQNSKFESLLSVII